MVDIPFNSYRIQHELRQQYAKRELMVNGSALHVKNALRWDISPSILVILQDYFLHVTDHH
jgi:hypothetical protein